MMYGECKFIIMETSVSGSFFYPAYVGNSLVIFIRIPLYAGWGNNLYIGKPFYCQ